MGEKLPYRLIVNASKLEFPKGVAFKLLFEMNRKNHFSYIGFLDAAAHAEIDRSEYLRWFDAERNYFLMDYIDPRIGFTGMLLVKVMTKDELKAALNAYEMFHSNSWYPDGYAIALQNALSLVEAGMVIPDRISVTVDSVIDGN